ncbi:general secretion pathway protein K [Candidatus Nitrosoglobus terrae]|uniref:General secretion pathway protein K n=1 Tax=Candidatus Nitrosoglobus terrae TaxID=1630141 RepID=A0A1Q2SK82_9GAMM|nr:general secretion pathway protein K [Candidatus Nitrosoglobus terrae]
MALKHQTLGSQATHRGIALVLVLWAITLVAVIAASFAYTVGIEATLAANLVGQAKARALAEAGIHYAIFDLLGSVQLHRFTADGTPYPIEIGSETVTISVRDVTGLIDLNTASRELLGGLFMAAGVPQDQLDSLLDVIEDWRDPDDIPHPQGAEDQDYIAAGLPYGAKDAPFEEVTELQQVFGVSLELYRRVEKSLTVFSGQAGINPAAASRETLLAIPGIDPGSVEAYVQARAESQAAGGTPPPPPAMGAGYLAQTGGVAYSLHAEAKITGGGVAIIEATVSPGALNTGGIIPNSSVFEWRSL